MKKKLGEKGFSLVELLVGVTILAVIAVPLLTAFLVTAHTSSRAKDIRNETVAAQKLVESMKATSIGAVIDDLAHHIMPFSAGSAELYTRIWNPVTNDYDETLVSDYSAVAEDGPGYALKLTNVTVNNKTYNAAIYLNAAKYKGASDDPGLNDAPIVNYKEMDAVFNQEKGVEDPDSAAASELAFQMMVATGEDVSSDTVYNQMDRTIEISIHKDAAQPDIVSFSAKYIYQIKGTNYRSESNCGIFYRGSYSADKNGLYFFFYPLHSSDSLNIYNTDNLDIRVFLIKQGADIDTYNPSINLYETKYSNDLEPIPIASIYFNLYNDSGASGGTYPYSYHPGKLVSGNFVYDWIYQKNYSARLVDTSMPNRIYEIKVEVYKPGSFTDPVAVFDTSAQANS